MNSDLTRRDFVQATLATGAVLPIAARAGPSDADKESRRLTILQINDTHGYLEPHQECFPAPGGFAYRQAGGFARIAALVKAIRRETEGRVLFCDSGDAFAGTHPTQASRGGVMVPVLNALGLAATTAHWEFAYGPRRLRQLVAQLNYPLLAINIYERDSERRAFPPYRVVEVGELRIGLVGIASNIVDKVMPPSFSTGLRFTQGRDELPQFITEMRQRGVDLIVLISHLGFPQDMKLLAEVSGVDVCLSGHTHNRLYRPARQGRTLVIQSGCHGSFLGRLDVEVRERQVVGYQHQLIEVAANVRPDAEVGDLVEREMAPYRRDLGEQVGETRTALNRFTALEATADNFLLQAVRKHTGAQMAFSNGWRFGAPIVRGPVVLNDLFNLVPMNPPVSTVELTGEELLAMLEENLERTYSANAFKQMGGYVKRCLGITVHMKMENPSGLRVQKLFVGDEEVQRGRVYTAAFITEQGVPGHYGRNRRELPDHAVEVMRAYLRRHGPVEAPLQGTFVAE